MGLGREQHAGDDASTRTWLGDRFQLVGEDELRGRVADDLGEVHQRLFERACRLGASGLREHLQVLDAAHAGFGRWHGQAHVGKDAGEAEQFEQGGFATAVGSGQQGDGLLVALVG